MDSLPLKSSSTALTSNARPWLDIIDRLRADGVHEDLALPQIAVMGDQSSGKSSVLEAISGIPFPKGTGLVTRCPIQLVMKKTKAGSPWQAVASISRKYDSETSTSASSKSIGQNTANAVSSHSRTLSQPSELAATISDLAAIVTRASLYGFSSDSVIVQISSPSSPDLTLIDLPGIVRTTTKGQSKEVIDEVNKLIASYLQQERTIILAVVPANQDVATVDILERAKIVDPTGDRTIGVLTKPDLVGEGGEEEVLATLSNNRAPLRLGYTIVKCRSQKELDSGMTIEEGRAVEEDFFRNHPSYSKLFLSQNFNNENSKNNRNQNHNNNNNNENNNEIDKNNINYAKIDIDNKSTPQDLFTIGRLTAKLTPLLVSRIQVALPAIYQDITYQLRQARQDLEDVGTKMPTNPREQQKVLMQIISDFVRLVKQALRGDYREPVLTTNPSLRLYTEAHKIYRSMAKGIEATGEVFQKPEFPREVFDEMQVLKGRELPGFHNTQVFYEFMVRNVETWRQHVESCKSLLVTLLSVALPQILHYQCPNLPLLHQAVYLEIMRKIDELNDSLSGKIEALLEKELDPYTANDAMLGTMNRIRQQRFEDAVKAALAASGPKPESMNSLKNDVKLRLCDWYINTHGVGNEAAVQDMVVLLRSYWTVASRRMIDNTIMTFEKDFMESSATELESDLFTLGSPLGAKRLAEINGASVDDINEAAENIQTYTLAQLFAEDPAIVKKRKELKLKVERLEKALNTLSNSNLKNTIIEPVDKEGN